MRRYREEIITGCKEKHFHPRLKRELPGGMKAYYVEEIAEGLRDAEVIVSTAEKLARVFRTSYYHVWTTTDLAGLEYSAALKVD